MKKCKTPGPFGTRRNEKTFGGVHINVNPSSQIPQGEMASIHAGPSFSRVQSWRAHRDAGAQLSSLPGKHSEGAPFKGTHGRYILRSMVTNLLDVGPHVTAEGRA